MGTSGLLIQTDFFLYRSKCQIYFDYVSCILQATQGQLQKNGVALYIWALRDRRLVEDR